MPYDYDADASPPERWLRFCNEVWEHDPEQIDLLQEVFGYLLTPDTSMQKFFMILGPTRGGKGVITKTLTSLVGKRSVCSPKLADLGLRFGLEATLGKSLATVADMRIGAKSDRQDIVGNILRIVGEDDVDVERKNIGGAWTGKLDIRIFIASNMMPPLPDVSGALIARLITLTTQRSFVGQEDPALGKTLQDELPGILNWSIEGWRRLHEHGRFTATAESKLVAEKMADLASPLNAFLRECCELDPEAKTPRDDVWRAYDQFVLMRDLPVVYSASNYFHRDLEVAAQHRITEFRPRVNGKQVKHWKGLRLLPQDDD
nr:phage/plasmid primase, P4 family [Devosia yakushimensis]